MSFFFSSSVPSTTLLMQDTVNRYVRMKIYIYNKVNEMKKKRDIDPLKMADSSIEAMWHIQMCGWS